MIKVDEFIELRDYVSEQIGLTKELLARDTGRTAEDEASLYGRLDALQDVMDQFQEFMENT